LGTCYCTICNSKFDNIDDHLIVHDKAKEIAARAKPLPRIIDPAMTLEQFKKHNDLFGSEMVLETAESYLDEKELADLKSYIGGSKFGKTSSRTHKRDIIAKRGIHLRGRLKRVS